MHSCDIIWNRLKKPEVKKTPYLRLGQKCPNPISEIWNISPWLPILEIIHFQCTLRWANKIGGSPYVFEISYGAYSYHLCTILVMSKVTNFNRP